MRRHIIAAIMAFALLANGLLIHSYATANTPQYFAVYRDGVIRSDVPSAGNSYDVWHAGYVNKATLSNSDAVLHKVSNYDGILGSTLTGFVSSNDLIGYYRPKQTLSADDITDINTVARDVLDNSDIDYCYYRMLGSKLGSGSTVEPEEISCLRCDGYVEYIYEKCGIRLFGDDGKWNISVNTIAVEQEHTYPDVFPRKQAVSYMKIMLGDLDADQTVTASDARTALQASASQVTLNSYQKWAADVDGDNIVEASDARFILRYSALLETTFPIEPTL